MHGGVFKLNQTIFKNRKEQLGTLKLQILMHGDATCPNLIVVKRFSNTEGSNSETLASANEIKLLRTGYAFIVRGTTKRPENS